MDKKIETMADEAEARAALVLPPPYVLHVARTLSAIPNPEDANVVTNEELGLHLTGYWYQGYALSTSHFLGLVPAGISMLYVLVLRDAEDLLSIE